LKILTVIGARPQFIKAMALSSALAREDGIREVLLHTGQHYDENMSAVFFRELGIPEPTYRFDLGGGLHGDMTGRQLTAIEQALLREQPDLCLVYGDTNSTLAGALAAAKLNIPVGHVEAGLRSRNRRMPEEINRIVTDHVSTWLFTPSDEADANLLREGFSPSQIHRVGDIMYDVARTIIDNPERRTDIAARLGLESRQYAVATVHRQENTDDVVRLREIFLALAALSSKIPVVVPVHPRTAARAAADTEVAALLPRLKVIDPIGYFDMGSLLAEASIVVTDSGGLQKEAYFHQVPCVTVRTETEWPELVELGWNRIPDELSRDAILRAMERAIGSKGKAGMAPYGEGNAAQGIISVLRSEARGA
jgi:UDP-GlcNAc3NAcA epimerase